MKIDLLKDEQEAVWAINCKTNDGYLIAGALVVLPSLVEAGPVNLIGDNVSLAVMMPNEFVSKTDRITAYNAKLTILEGADV